MLTRALERTGGPEDDGVRGLKDGLKAAVITRLGSFEEEKFYLVSTLVDPRWKDMFFTEEATTNIAKNFLIEEVENEMDVLQPEAREETPARRESSSSDASFDTSGNTSIIAQMRKRIRLERAQVGCYTG
jgi:hypothetical protein